MKELVPIPSGSLKHLQEGQQTELGHRFVVVRLKDGRLFEPAVESEGYIIQVKGQENIPFTADDVEVVETSSKRWNFSGVAVVAKNAPKRDSSRKSVRTISGRRRYKRELVG